jgi:hypothetical protein
MNYGLTLYDIIDAPTGAAAATLRHAYEEKLRLLRSQQSADMPDEVVVATGWAREMLDEAWRVLGDPDQRREYDLLTGLTRPGYGLNSLERPFSDRGSPDMLDMLGVTALFNRLGPGPTPRSRKIDTPDVRGLFWKPCHAVLAKAGLDVRIVKLTQRPRPVPGLIVAQSPDPGARVRRGSAVTVHVWHPSAGAS